MGCFCSLKTFHNGLSHKPSTFGSCLCLFLKFNFVIYVLFFEVSVSKVIFNAHVTVSVLIILCTSYDPGLESLY